MNVKNRLPSHFMGERGAIMMVYLPTDLDTLYKQITQRYNGCCLCGFSLILWPVRSPIIRGDLVDKTKHKSSSANHLLLIQKFSINHKSQLFNWIEIPSNYLILFQIHLLIIKFFKEIKNNVNFMK